MRLAVREKPVDDQAQDREQEHDEAPQQLVRGRAIGFEDFHPHEDIQDQNNEAQHAAAGAVFPGITVGACLQCLFGHGEGDEEEIEHE